MRPLGSYTPVMLDPGLNPGSLKRQTNPEARLWLQVTHTGCCAGRRLSDVMVGTGALEADGPGSKAQVFCSLAAGSCESVLSVVTQQVGSSSRKSVRTMPGSQQVGEPLLCFLGEMLVELPEMAASGRENQLLQVDPFRGCGGKCPRPPSSLQHRDPCFCWPGGLKVRTGVWGDPR